MQNWLSLKIYPSCKNDPSCKSDSVQNCLLVQKCTLVRKCLLAKMTLSANLSSCNFVPSCNFVRSCNFDCDPFSTALSLKLHVKKKLALNYREIYTAVVVIVCLTRRSLGDDHTSGVACYFGQKVRIFFSKNPLT